MMEMEEAEWEDTDLSFFCPVCDFEVEGSTSLPIVYEHGGEEHLPVDVFCFSCRTHFDGWVRTDWSNCTIELDDHPDIEIETTPARGWIRDYAEYDQDYFDWLEQQELSSRTVLNAFLSTAADIQALASSVTLSPSSQMLARMLLVQSITSLEVFLSDTLILAVLNSKSVQEKLLKSKTLQIGSREFKLADAIGVENFAKEKLLESLNAVSFHNLGKVSSFFRIGMGIEILPEGDDAQRIEKAVRMRHDCVHRNGKARETSEVHSIDQSELMGLTEALRRMVRTVDDKVSEFESNLKSGDDGIAF